MFKKHPFISRLVVFIVLPVFVVLAFFYVYLEKSLAQYEGVVNLAGLAAQVELTFDPYGTPSIVAHTDQDAYFAQGYMHASERMWQMELQRRVVHGRLSEVFGKRSLSMDIWMRTLGLHIAARSVFDGLSQQAQKALISYAKGVNAWLKQSPQLQPEFILFNLKPELWSPIDSIAWQKMFALSLGGNMYEELNRIAALAELTPEQLQTFYPYGDKNDYMDFQLDEAVSSGKEVTKVKNIVAREDTTTKKGLTIVKGELRDRMDWYDFVQDLKGQGFTGERYTGSNAWVVSGEHTQSGFPILANDPHLTVAMPSLWYSIRLKGDLLDVSGMSLVGIPGVMLGRSTELAWGVTNLVSDQQDLFSLKIPHADNSVYLTKQGSKPITQRQETIHVRTSMPEFLNKKILPITVDIRTTDLGPIVSDVFQSDKVYALKWAALDHDDRSFDAFFRLQYAKNWQEFRAATQLLKSPGLHFLYADEDGNIGSQVAGKFPIRGRGVGIVPQQAFNPADYWQEYVDFEQLPSQFNPESGMIISANNEIKPDKNNVLIDKSGSSDSFIISQDWAPPTRNERITELLLAFIASGQKLGVENMIEIQRDQVDLGARKLLPVITQQLLRDQIIGNAPSKIQEESVKAFQLLSEWNGEYNIDSAAASVYQYWLSDISKNIFADELAGSWSPSGGNGLFTQLSGLISEIQLFEILTADVKRAGGKQPDWCEIKVDDLIPCQKELIDGYYSAIQALVKQTSSDTKDWQWGKLHYVEFTHQPLGAVKLLDVIFKTRLEAGGSTNTVNVANANGPTHEGFAQTLGASFRQIFELGTDNTGHYLISTGVSGHFQSVHYKDMMEAFTSGDTIDDYGVYGSYLNSSQLILRPSGNHL